MKQTVINRLIPKKKTQYSSESRTKILMSWDLYTLIVNSVRGETFKKKRLRIALLLLAITRFGINEVLVIRIKDLYSLQDSQPWIEIKTRRLLIQKPEECLAIKERLADLEFLCREKESNDFIFTSTITSKCHVSRETLTRSINKHLNNVYQQHAFSQKLTSRSFKDWEGDNLT